ncbi:MAG: hypothetical protein V9F03_13480 [Microthrixaceae bacterium]
MASASCPAVQRGYGASKTSEGVDGCLSAVEEIVDLLTVEESVEVPVHPLGLDVCFGGRSACLAVHVSKGTGMGLRSGWHQRHCCERNRMVRGTMNYKHISYETRGNVGYLTLNRPDELNAFTATMAFEIMDAFDRTDADDDITGGNRDRLGSGVLRGGRSLERRRVIRSERTGARR